jgi:hypothetical protein
MKTLKQWQEQIFDWASSKGWWERDEAGRLVPRNLFELLFLMHTELSEAGEELRNGYLPSEVWYSTDKHGHSKPEGFPVELADCAIRILDTCQACDIDLDSMIALKMAYNEKREFRHGGKLA